MMHHKTSTRQNKDEIQYEYLKYVHNLEIEKRKQLDGKVKTLLTANAILLGFILTYGREFFANLNTVIKLLGYETVARASIGIVLILASFLLYLTYYLVSFMCLVLEENVKKKLDPSGEHIQKINGSLIAETDMLRRHTNVYYILIIFTTLFLLLVQ